MDVPMLFQQAGFSCHSEEDSPPMYQSSSSGVSDNLSSILSASSYPFPGGFPGPTDHMPDEQYHAKRMFLGGLQLDNNFYQGQIQTDDELQPLSLGLPGGTVAPAPAPVLAMDTYKAPAPMDGSVRKVGRPRKSTRGMAEQGPQERRRAQVRLAQRAYRSRKEADASSLKERAAMLESALDQMRSSVIQLGDKLIQSGVLDSREDLTSHLGQTVQKSLLLVREAKLEKDNEGLPFGSIKISSESPPAPPPRIFTMPTPPTHHQLVRTIFKDSPSDNPIDCSTFIRRLRLSCITQACLVLRDMSIPEEKLRGTFKLLFTVASRQRIAFYFESALAAILNQTPMEDWGEIPFFRLGGAGSHYPADSPRDSPSDVLPYRYKWQATIKDPLSELPEEAKTELDGDWFDIHDLEGYLREQNIQLRVSPPGSSDGGMFSEVPINATRLRRELIRRAICLGRTPGFRRMDVEKALRSAVWVV